MKKVFICSRYRADENHTVEENIASAKQACLFAIEQGCAPYAPHLYLPEILDDNDPPKRELGISIGQEFLKICDELWQWSESKTNVSSGMASEVLLAKKLGIPIKIFDTFGNLSPFTAHSDLEDFKVAVNEFLADWHSNLENDSDFNDFIESLELVFEPNEEYELGYIAYDKDGVWYYSVDGNIVTGY